MKWYWHRAGGHTHVRVFMGGAKCGDLCFRNEEFDHLFKHLLLVEFIEQSGQSDDDESVEGPTAAEADEILGRKHYSEH